MSEKAQQILRDKIAQFQEARAITADAAQKFQLDQQVQQVREELAELEQADDKPGRAESVSSLAPIVEANPAAATLFVGREAELAQLAAALLGPAVRPVAVVGMPGVGKSYLADRFALLHPDSFPGGVYRVVLDPESPPASAASLLGELADRLRVPPEPAAGLAERLRVRLLAPRSLLHVENADGAEAGRAAADLVRLLPGCPVVVSARLQTLGRSAGWEHVELRWFSAEDALAQLEKELGKKNEWVLAADREGLVRELGGLPLALHLAAGYLLAGQTATGFLAELRTAGLDLEAADPADPMAAARRGRELLAGTLRASVRLLGRRSAGVDLVEAFRRLGFAPASGFGASLGAALAGLSGNAFETLKGNATRLSLLAPVESRERQGRAWRLHPLLAEVLRAEAGDAERAAAQQRSTEWFLVRLPEEQQGLAWHELGEETEALAAWLAAVSAEERVQVARAGSWYAMHNGPFHAWRAFCEQALARALEASDRSHLLLTLGQVARKAGALEQALLAAAEKQELDRARGEEREAALAASLRADVLEVRGELDEALRIRREEELPVYEQLGDVRLRTETLGQIADVLQARGELDETLRIRREEELPVYERLGDERATAVTQAKIADVLQDRGELDEALRIRREEALPVFERLGDVRSWAVTLGKIADVLAVRGRLDEALRIRREEQLPVFERLGDVRERAITLGKIADIREVKGELDEALRIRREEELPVYERLGDVRARTVTIGKIADVHQARGELDEALRIRREEELPVYKRLGDIHLQAVTLGQIADVLQARGEFDEAFRIRREEELPVYERLAGRRDVLVCQAKIALLLLQRGASGDREEAARLLRFALAAAEAMRIPEAERIRQFFHDNDLDAPPPPSLPGKAAG